MGVKNSKKHTVGGGVKINEYKFEDLKIGLEESFQYEVTPEKIERFRELTGDINPLHVNDDFAANYGFTGRVVYGMLSASLISTLGGVYLPGRYCLIQQIEGCKFLSPVYLGDVLTVTGTVKELNESVRQAVIQVSIRNQESKRVLKAILKVGFLE